ncbi:acetoacetate decarboxylase family protein [Neobacillus sp. NPDC097160]|uniref:acetoacetate decarboxylase family protein n=1 Tax=Neobacillus sp. NPDC097160 TaxID=3364298 RepID=UPI00380EBF6D
MRSNANNVPVHAPLFPDPFVPYQCKDYVSLFAVAEASEEEIKRILSYTPFEYIENKIVLSISDFSKTDKLSYMDCAIVVPVKYGDKYGGYYIYEYENNDAAIAAGRDLWGYPKKYAEIILKEQDGEIYGYAKKDGEVFLELKADTSKAIGKISEPKITPHFNIRTIPKTTGGIYFQEIIERDTSPDFVLHNKTFLHVDVQINGAFTQPLNQLGPITVLGGGVIKGDFYATEKNGWGKVLETIKHGEGSLTSY